MPVIKGSLLRYDGRLANEMRNTNFTFKRIDSKGIVSWRQGNTIVNTTISQRKDKAQLSVNIKFQETSRNEQMSDKRIYEMEQKIFSIFSGVLGADQQLEVNVNVIGEDGSLFSAILNSISLSFASFGIAIEDMCVSVTLNENIDLCAEEEKNSFSTCLVFCPNKQEILYLESFGKVQKLAFKNTVINGIDACKQLHTEFRSFFITEN
ncbi:Exosome non-catalytic core component [Glugoides intestinalis]